jgi:ABC-2 type transport system ATP-binding protein
LDEARGILTNFSQDRGAPTATAQTISMTIVDPERQLPVITRDLDEGGVIIQSLAVSKPTLEDAFLRLAGRKLTITGGN